MLPQVLILTQILAESTVSVGLCYNYALLHVQMSPDI